MKCQMGAGCKNEAKWMVTHLFGERKTLPCCDRCKPGTSKFAKSVPSFYDVKPIGEKS